MASPEALLERRKTGEEPTGRRAFQDLDGVSNRNRRRKTDKQVEMVRLNFQGDNRLPFVGTKCMDHLRQRLSHVASDHIVAILGTPNHVVGGLIDHISVMDRFNHIHMVTIKNKLGTPHDSSRGGGI